MLGTVLVAIGGFFAAVAVVPIAIKVSGGPEPNVAVAIVVIVDVVVIIAVLLRPFLLTATGCFFAAVAVVLGFVAPAEGRFWWRQQHWWLLGCWLPLRVRVQIPQSLEHHFQYHWVDQVHHFHLLGVCAIRQPRYYLVRPKVCSAHS